MKKFDHQKIYAFSLVELMIVLVIIAMLAAVAIPTYNDYVIRSKFVEALLIAKQKKAIIEEYILVNDALPVAPAGATDTELYPILAAFSAPSDTDLTPYLKRISLVVVGTTTAQISMLFNAAALYGPSDTTTGEPMLILEGTFSNKKMSWVCRTGGTVQIPSKYLPKGCK